MTVTVSTRSPDSPRLPWEICDQIIDELSPTALATRTHGNWSDDVLIATLLSCALTCQAWVPRTRYHLYRSVQLLLHLQKRMGPNGQHSQVDITIKCFFATLDMSPHLRSLIFEMSIFWPGYSALGDVILADVYYSLLKRGPILLPNLRTLIFNVPLPPLHPSFLCIRHPFRRVHSLSFNEDMKIGSMLDLRRFLDSFFPNITSFHSLNISFQTPYFNLPFSPKIHVRAPSIVRISTNGIPSNFTKWLSSTRTVTSLRELRINSHDLPFLGPLGQSIENLWVNMFHLKEATDIDLGAAVFPVLRHLTIRLWDAEIIDLCSAFSRSPPSSRLSLIRILKLTQTDNCALLDDTIATQPFASLKELQIHEYYKECFPKVKAMGILISLISNEDEIEIQSISSILNDTGAV
ncbi:hypothetical protein C8Q75DRAFT_468801 [Abortiporus biennis]|nr:hypothetical protein C8Q75DRAFT_468801 [Abortiporus biennis]